MENTATYLTEILSTNLLAPSVSALRTPLGYAGASTLYRIAQGTASVNAIANFCNRLQKVYGLTPEILEQIYLIACFGRRFSQMMKQALAKHDPDAPFIVIKAFIESDYSVFTHEFIDNELNEWLALKRANAEGFFAMIAYYYIKATKIRFYTKGIPFRRECASILEPLGERLMENFPGNVAAINFIYAYSKTNIYGPEAPILWNLVTSMGAMFMIFSAPIESLRNEDLSITLTGLPRRCYWRGSNSDNIILSLEIDNLREGSGGYEIFTISPAQLRIQSICILTFTEDECLLNLKGDYCTKHGTYNWDGTRLSTQWSEDKTLELSTGTTWTLLPLGNSRSLRTLDCKISDEMLHRASIIADGFEPIPGFEIRDVIISRSKFFLHFRNGRIFSVAVDQAPFLKKVLPTEPVHLYRCSSDGEIVVFWHRIRHCLPFELFTEVSGET